MRMENTTPISPACPTCGKEMRFTGYSPMCDGVIYDFSCSTDGDRLTWRHGRAAANIPEIRSWPRGQRQPGNAERD